jgi:hypothetical protein
VAPWTQAWSVTPPPWWRTMPVYVGNGAVPARRHPRRPAADRRTSAAAHRAGGHSGRCGRWSTPMFRRTRSGRRTRCRRRLLDRVHVC